MRWILIIAALGHLLAAGTMNTMSDRIATTVTHTAPRLPGALPGRGEPRGYLTTPQELAQIGLRAAAGDEPYREAAQRVLEAAERPWDFPLRPLETCEDADTPAWLDNGGGIPALYARALAYHLTGERRYAAQAAAILERIMTAVLQISLEDQGCRLRFAWGTPELVASADLIEPYWAGRTCRGPLGTRYDDTRLGAGDCKALFQNWLVKNPYYVVSYAALDSQSNWGAAATNTLAYIADYLWDRPEAQLVHRSPPEVNGGREGALSPARAYARANRLMFFRMNGYAVEYHSRSSCDLLSGPQQSPLWAPVKSQITPEGIIPEDARREQFCNIPAYDGEYQNYPQLHLGHNIQQCELMLRRGDPSCYENVSWNEIPRFTYTGPDGRLLSAPLYPGRGSLERAIKAVIVDSGTEWRHDSALAVAYRYYVNHSRLPGVEQWVGQLDRAGDCGQDICFGLLTHGFAPGETPALPPAVAPPQDPEVQP